MQEMSRKTWTRWRVRVTAAGAMGLVACGEASTDGRWEDDAELPLVPGEQDTLPPVSPEGDCVASWIGGTETQGFAFAEPPGFWLGSQAQKTVAVDGFGHLVLGEPPGEPPARRYARQLTYSIAPDGALEDASGHRLLGYLPTTSAVSGDCLGVVRLPVTAPPRPTFQISIQANLDARNPVNDFDVNDPDGTSNGSTSVTVFDSRGGAHTLDVYFNNMGGGLYAVNVLSDGGDLAGGTAGVHTLLTSGTLQFANYGALEVETLPELYISFVEAATNQAVAIDFGHSLAEGSTHGLGGTTSFASDTAVYAQSQDGLPAGMGVDASIDGWGTVHALFDSGASFPVGTLALARFPREAELLTDADGLLRETAESGEPLLGRPLDPGRGTLRTD